MTPRRSVGSLAAASACALLAYAAAAPDLAEPLLALLIGAIGFVLSARLRGAVLPNWIAGVLAIVVLVRTVNAGLADGLSVHDFAGLVLWLLVIKVFDRRSGVDDAQTLALTVFLCVASMLLSNGVTVALISFAYLPCLAYSAMRVQLGLQSDRAARMAEKSAGVRVPLRSAASPGAGASLARTSVYAVAGGFLIAIVVFVIIPRGAGLSRLGNWGNPGVGRVVGFNDRVNVGMGGVISRSNTVVMHLRLTDSDGNAIGGMGSVKYLRGAVLDTYENGSWRSGAPPHGGARSELLPEETVSFGGSGQGGVWHQEYTVLNAAPDAAYLFTIWRPNEITYLDPGTAALNKRDKTAVNFGRGGKFRYRVRSTPYESTVPAGQRRRRASFESPTVRRVASDILRERGIEPNPRQRPIADDIVATNAFRDYFWTNYTYKLDTPPAPTGRDPVDWFLSEGREGHCEYYAASMAALCRSVGIPARVVTGYVAIEYDSSTSHYIIRESNAHAWVEVQTQPDRWKRVEPTPPTDLLDVHAPAEGLLARAGRALDVLNYRWVNSVVAFDSDRRSSLLGWSDPATRSVHEQFARALDFTRLTPSGVLIRVAIHIVITIVGGFLVGYAAIMLIRRWRLSRSRRPRAMIDRIENRETRDRVRGFPLHEELLGALALAGFRKPEWQPLLAWARSLGGLNPDLSPDVAEAAALFYVLRFAGRDLDESERKRARELIDRIRANSGTHNEQ